MAGNPIEAVTKKFDESIYGIRDSKAPEINDIAKRCVEKIRRHEFNVVLNNLMFNIPTVTSFELVEIPGGPRQQYAPAIVIDAEKTLSGTTEGIQGDLVRTLAIADQFPDNGYQRRLRAVYKQAVQIQTKWLEAANTPLIDFDPRTNTDLDSLLKSLMGEARYYTDAGFDDWKAAIKDYRRSGQDPNALPALAQLESSTAHVIVMRQRFGSMNHTIAARAHGPAYFQMSPAKRAEMFAYSLMGASLYARGPQS